MTHTKYVAGFLFRDDGEPRVALIQKQRPAWQAGRLNGIGGHIEEGETPLEAMVREFREETGATVDDWREFVTMTSGPGSPDKSQWTVHFFAAHGDHQLTSVTDETVDWYRIDDFCHLPILPNLRWLIPMALDKDGVTAVVRDPS